MLGTNSAEEQDYVILNSDGTENASHEPWILLGRRDRKVRCSGDLFALEP